MFPPPDVDFSGFNSETDGSLLVKIMQLYAEILILLPEIRLIAPRQDLGPPACKRLKLGSRSSNGLIIVQLKYDTNVRALMKRSEHLLTEIVNLEDLVAPAVVGLYFRPPKYNLIGRVDLKGIVDAEYFNPEIMLIALGRGRARTT